MATNLNSVFISVAFSISSAMAFSADDPLYTYQAQIINSPVDCATEARQWSDRFSNATKTQVKSVSCRSEQEIKSTDQTYKVYNLGLTYSGQLLRPYSILIGKPDLHALRSMNQAVLYPTLNSCLEDSLNQTAIFEQETGLTAVTVSCVDESYSSFRQFYLKIEGFGPADKFGRITPKKDLHHFSPYSFSELNQNRTEDLAEFLLNYDLRIIKKIPGLIIYYRAGGPAPVQTERFLPHRNQAECQTQLPSFQSLLKKAQSPKALVWCEGNRLHAIFEGTFSLYKVALKSDLQYRTIEQCDADKEFVLSDSRNAAALGALCAPDIYDPLNYAMTLFRKSN